MVMVFIFDLYLDDSWLQIIVLFECLFVSVQVCVVSVLYIFGDLVEVWIGDDDDVEFFGCIVVVMWGVSESGVLVYFIVGNCDFFIGEVFV